MKPTEINTPPGTQAVGYAKLILDHQLAVFPPAQQSFVARAALSEHHGPGSVRVVYPPQYAPGDTDVEQLEFALKHDGVCLDVLAAYFQKRGAAVEPELVAHIRSKPTGMFVRRLWFFYEWLTGRTLPLDDMTTGNYQPVLDPKLYLTSKSNVRIRRQRLVDNLLGGPALCPVIRQSASLQSFVALDLAASASKLVDGYGAVAIRRAVSCLYSRETRSSFEIEREHPENRRVDRYIAMLERVAQTAALDEAALVVIQNETVDPRYAEPTFRSEQNYVGQTLGFREKVHYLPPRPEDVRSLMDGWFACAQRLAKSDIDPVVHAAVLSFTFVFIHPFIDGNGRMHRLIVHQVLSSRGFTPLGLIFPVSAVILDRRQEYDDALESFSRPLMAMVNYDLDDAGKVTVAEDTSLLYRFPDLTRFAEDLYRWVQATIQKDFKFELDFVVAYEKTERRMREVLDMPDKKRRLFILVASSNAGRLSKAKRAQFSELSDAEVAALEAVVQEHMPDLAGAALLI